MGTYYDVRDATTEILRREGTRVFEDSCAFESYMVDFVDPDSPEARVLLAQCDERFLSHFAVGAQAGTCEAIEEASVRAADVLSQERMIDEDFSRRLCRGIADGICDALGLQPYESNVDSSATEISEREHAAKKPDDAPSNRQDEPFASKEGHSVANGESNDAKRSSPRFSFVNGAIVLGVVTVIVVLIVLGGKLEISKSDGGTLPLVGANLLANDTDDGDVTRQNGSSVHVATLTFEDGLGNIMTREVAIGSSVTLPKCQSTREGYLFDSWKETNSSVRPLQKWLPGDEYEAYHDETFIAEWSDAFPNPSEGRYGIWKDGVYTSQVLGLKIVPSASVLPVYPGLESDRYGGGKLINYEQKKWECEYMITSKTNSKKINGSMQLLMRMDSSKARPIENWKSVDWVNEDVEYLGTEPQDLCGRTWWRTSHRNTDRIDYNYLTYADDGSIAELVVSGNRDQVEKMLACITPLE